MAFTHVRFPWQAGNGRIASFGMDFETPVSLTGAELQTLADAASTEWLSNAGLFGTDLELKPAQAQGQQRIVLDPGGPDERAVRAPTTTEFVGAGVDTAGTVASQSSVPGTALVVTLRTAAPGRRARGRVYTPPPPESLVNGAGVVSDAAARVTMVEDLAAAVEGSLVPVDVDHVVWSLTYDEQNEVTNYTTNGEADYQRRRGRQLS